MTQTISREALLLAQTQAVQTAGQSARSQPVRQTDKAQGGFDQLLRQELGKREQTRSVAFSKHAISRAQERGIQVTPNLMERLEGSVEKAQAKGATNILAMDADRAAFIINVPNARVITAITREEMQESVFTNIDGAVFL